MKAFLLFFMLLVVQFCSAQKTQVIDYATYIGGLGVDYVANLQLSDNNDILLAASATTGCVTTPGVHKTIYSGGVSDALLQKRDKAGNLIWSTYYGGSLEDATYKIILLKSGKIAMSGQTNSNANIAKEGYQNNYGGGSYDGFLAVFNDDGTLDWATYYGGSGEDAIYGLVEDSKGNLYISGYTYSGSKIATLGSYQLALAGNSDGFLAKFSEDGQLLWGTYIGGTGLDAIYTMDIDVNDQVWLGGISYSTTGLSTTNAYRFFNSGRGDGLLISFDQDGKKVYSTYYGGGDRDEIYVVDIDKEGNIWFGGPTTSSDNIATPGAINETNAGSTDVFLVKFDKDRNRKWGTYLGGNAWDTFFGMDVDPKGNAILCLMTQSSNFWPIRDAMQESFGGGPWDAVYTKIDGDGGLIWSTFHGGNGNDRGIDIKVNSEGNFVFFIIAGSQGLYTENADDKLLNGAQDCLLSIIKEDEMSSINDHQTTKENIMIYPNPASESLSLDIDNIEDYIIQIYDYMGIHYLTKHNSSNILDISTLKNGYYIIKLMSKQKGKTKEISFIKI